MVAGFNFRPPQYQLAPGNRPQASVWGPVDVSQMAKEGIGGLWKNFTDARQNQTEYSARQTMADEVLKMGQPGGLYGGGGGSDRLTGSTAPDAINAPYNAKGKMPTFAAIEGVNPSSGLGGLIDTVSTTYKLAPDYLGKLVQIESGGKADAFNKGSKAAGLGQFVPGTWRTYGKGASPFDPGANLDATARFTVDNANALRKGLGREPTQGELYLAHQQGAGGALALLRDPNARAIDVVKPSHVASNVPAAYRSRINSMTAGEFAGLWTGKFGEPRPAFGGGAPAPRPSGIPEAAPPIGLNITPQQVQQQTAQQATAPGRDPRTATMTREEIEAQDAARGVPSAPMPGSAAEQPATSPTSAALQPSPADAPGAAQVVQANQQQAQERSQAAKTVPASSFMGLPSMAGPGTVVPPVPGQMTMPQQGWAPPGSTAFPGSRGVTQPVPPPVGTGQPPQAPAPQPAPPAAAPAPAAAPVPQQAPVPAPAPPASISGGGGQGTVAGGAGTPITSAGGLSPSTARYLAAGIRAGDPYAQQAAAALMSAGATGKRDIREVGGQLVEIGQDGTPRVIFGSPTTKPTEIKEIDGVSHQWNGQQWVPFSAGGGQGRAQFQIVSPAERARYGLGNINPEDKRDYQIDLRTMKAEPVSPVSTREDPAFERYSTLAKEYSGNKVVQDFQIQNRSLAQIEQALQDPDGASDLSLIFNYMRMLDPGSVVREGEFALAGQTTGVPDQTVALYNRIVSGQRLTDQQREQFANRAAGLMESSRATYNEAVDPIRARADRFGIVADEVAPKMENKRTGPMKVSRTKPEESPGTQAPAPASGAKQVQIGDNQYPTYQLGKDTLPLVPSAEIGEQLARGTEYIVQGEKETRTSRGSSPVTKRGTPRG